MNEVWRRLQPLRVASGWTIDINGLYAVDPSPETIDWFYGSVLVGGHDRFTPWCFDARWEPEGDPGGRYVVDFLRLARPGADGARDAGATELAGTWTTRSRLELVDALETFMFTREPPRAAADPGAPRPETAET